MERSNPTRTGRKEKKGRKAVEVLQKSEELQSSMTKERIDDESNLSIIKDVNDLRELIFLVDEVAHKKINEVKAESNANYLLLDQEMKEEVKKQENSLKNLSKTAFKGINDLKSSFNSHIKSNEDDKKKIFQAEADISAIKQEMIKLKIETGDLRGDVSAIKRDVHEIKVGMNKMNVEMNEMKTDINGIKTEMKQMKTEMNEMKTEINGVKTEMNWMKTEMNEMKTEMNEMKTEMNEFKLEMRSEMSGLKKEIENMNFSMHGYINFLVAEIRKLGK